jgi:aryl-alcohol dehydrogenase-like predicted oxidoreductase
MYNLVKRQVEVELLPLARSADLAVFPYSPLAGGLLTGKYGTTPGSGEGRLVANKMYSIRYRDEAVYQAAAELTAIAGEVGCHPATLAVAWAGSHPAVTAPLIGGRSLEQLRPSLAAADFELDDELRGRITALTPDPPPATDRSEEVAGG